MKTTTELGTIKNPVIVIDPELNKYKDVVLFPEKVKKAKAAMARLGLPGKVARPTES